MHEYLPRLICLRSISLLNCQTVVYIYTHIIPCNLYTLLSCLSNAYSTLTIKQIEQSCLFSYALLYFHPSILYNDMEMYEISFTRCLSSFHMLLLPITTDPLQFKCRKNNVVDCKANYFFNWSEERKGLVGIAIAYRLVTLPPQSRIV